MTTPLGKYTLPLVLALLSFSCAKGSETSTIRLAYLQNDLHHLPAFVALEEGLFQREGLSATVAGIFRAGPELMSAFAAGSIDVGYVGLAPATVAVGNNTAQIKILAQVNQNGSALIVRKDDPSTSLVDLKGKTIAIPGHSSIQDFLLRRALSQHHLDTAFLNIITIKPPEMANVLTRRQIDGFIAWEPYPALAITKDMGKILYYSKDIWQDHPCCVLVARTPFIRQNPLIQVALRKAHLASLEYIEHHREAAIRIGMKYTGMDRITVECALKNIQFNYHLNLHHLLEYTEFLNTLGYTAIADPKQFIHSLVITEEEQWEEGR